MNRSFFSLTEVFRLVVIVQKILLRMRDSKQMAVEKHVVVGNVTGQGRVIVTPLPSALHLPLNSIAGSGSTVPVTPQQTRQPNLVCCLSRQQCC